MSPKVEIAGRVADSASGLAVAGVEVRAIARTLRTSRELARTVTDERGGFLVAYAAADPGSDPELALPREPPVPADPVPMPGPRAREVVSFAVYREETLLPGKDGAETEWDGRMEVLLLVDAEPELPPVPDPAPEADPEPEPLPVALTITELGEALAVTAASIQQELARYPTANGAFVLDDLDIEIPVGFGVDRLGQLRVDVGAIADAAGTADHAGRLRLRVKPLLEPPEPRSVTAPQALDTLDALSPELIAKLQAQRVYSVGDLLRISRNPAGRRALDELGVPDVDDVRARAEVIALPTIPSRVAESLVHVGVADPKAFVAADPSALAERLSERLGEPLAAADVMAWQARTRPLITIPRVEAEVR